MPINRGPFNALIDDSGSGTDGTPWNKTKIKDVLLDPIDAALATASVPGGATTQVQFNDAGALAGHAGLTFDKATSKLTVGGDVALASGKYIRSSVNNAWVGIWGGSSGTPADGGGINVQSMAGYGNVNVILGTHANATFAVQSGATGSNLLSIASATGAVTVYGPEVAFNQNALLRRNTADGADTGRLDFCGGGGNDQARGATVGLFGNEAAAAAGYAVIGIGSVAGAAFSVWGTSQWFNINGATGATTLAGPVTLSSALASDLALGTSFIKRNTSAGADNSYLMLTAAGAPNDTTRSALVWMTGNQFGGLPGSAVINTGNVVGSCVVVRRNDGNDAFKVDGSTGVISSPTQFRCKVGTGTPVTTTPGAGLTLAYGAGTEQFDVGNMHDTASNPSRITIPAGGAGTYLITANVLWDAVIGGGLRRAMILVSGSTLTAAVETASTSDYVYLCPTAIANLSPGDYVETQVLQTSTGNINIFSSTLAVVKLW